jgi:hypothetical protein
VLCTGYSCNRLFEVDRFFACLVLDFSLGRLFIRFFVCLLFRFGHVEEERVKVEGQRRVRIKFGDGKALRQR